MHLIPITNSRRIASFSKLPLIPIWVAWTVTIVMTYIQVQRIDKLQVIFHICSNVQSTQLSGMRSRLWAEEQIFVQMNLVLENRPDDDQYYNPTSFLDILIKDTLIYNVVKINLAVCSMKTKYLENQWQRII